MATVSEGRLSCGCADEKHLGTPCDCMGCAEGDIDLIEHPSTPCPLPPEQRPEAVRQRAREARKQEVKEVMRTAVKMAHALLLTASNSKETMAGTSALAIKLYDELKAAEAEAKAEADAVQVSAPAKAAEPVIAQNMAGSQFKIWKTINLGTGLRTADDFRLAIKKAGHLVCYWANDTLDRRAFKAADKEIEVDLVVVSVADLGFSNGAPRKDIYRKVQELGLMLCPAEVGPQLRIQCPDQPVGDRLIIGMEPITASFGGLLVFRVGRDGRDSWLDGGYGDPDYLLHSTF